ncbi:MAG TPA: AAA family ATPase [Enteractinococcus sp.]
MIRIGFVGFGGDIAPKFTEAIGSDVLILPMPASAQPSELLDGPEAVLPEVLILDARISHEHALEFASRVESQYPHVVLLVVTGNPEAIGLEAMRSGVSDVIAADAEVGEINQAIEMAAQRAARFAPLEAESQVPEAEGRVITVVSAKGGVGKTTVATNIAVALATAVPHSTVIVDFDLQFGDVATALGLEPEEHLEDALHSAASGDVIALKSHLTMHDSGLYVMPAPTNPATADTVSGAQTSQLLQMLAKEFQYVVVDTATGLNDHTLGALDETTDPLLLTELSVPGIHGLRKVVDTLSLLQMFTDCHHVVLNFANTAHGVSPRDLEASLGVPVEISIPISRRAPAALNVGVPLAQSKPRDPLVKALTPLIDQLLPEYASFPVSDRRWGRR